MTEGPYRGHVPAPLDPPEPTLADKLRSVMKAFQPPAVPTLKETEDECWKEIQKRAETLAALGYRSMTARVGSFDTPWRERRKLGKALKKRAEQHGLKVSAIWFTLEYLTLSW